MKDYRKLAEENSPCIIVTPRQEFINGKWITFGLTVLEESEHSPDCMLGHSFGVGSRYDYGFMQIDVERGINVFVISIH